MKIIFLLSFILISAQTVTAQSLTIWNESHDYDITELKISYPYSKDSYNFTVTNNYNIDWNTSIKLDKPIYGRSAIIYPGLGGKGYYFIKIVWSNGFKIERTFGLFTDRTVYVGALNDGEDWKR